MITVERGNERKNLVGIWLSKHAGLITVPQSLAERDLVQAGYITITDRCFHDHQEFYNGVTLTEGWRIRG